MAEIIGSTFDTSTTEGKVRVFNAQNGSSISLKSMENGEIIPVTAVLQYRDVVDSYGKPQEVTITVLFAEDGAAYAGVSDTVAGAGEKLIDLFADTGLETINVAVVKQVSGKGNEFLNLRVAL